MDAIDSSGMVVTVSVSAQSLNTEPPRSVIVLEPVERTTACITFDSTVSESVMIIQVLSSANSCIADRCIVQAIY